MKFKKIKKIAKGWSSYIWKIKTLDKKVCTLKETREKSNRKNLAEREGKYLTIANSVGIGPKIVEINYEKNYIIYEYIKGTTLLDFIFSKEFDNAKREDIYKLIKEIIRQALVLDSIGLRHTQLQVGKNILITKKIHNGNTEFIPTIIDFEKASVTESARRLDRTNSSEAVKEKNFGQIASFLLYNPNGIVAKKIREKLDLEL